MSIGRSLAVGLLALLSPATAALAQHLGSAARYTFEPAPVPEWEQSSVGRDASDAQGVVLQFPSPATAPLIRSASLRWFGTTTGGDADVTVYGLHDRSGAPNVRLGTLQVRSGAAAWYELDVSGYVARQTAATKSLRFGMRPARGAQISATATTESNRPELRVTRCTAPRCPAKLGVFVGNSAGRVREFETWLGRPVDLILAFTGHANWADYDGSIPWAIELWGAVDRPVVWSIPLFPRGGELERAATGEYDPHYQQAARELVRSRPSDSVIYVRTGWEWNGDWFPWGVPRADNAGAFIAAFRHFVDAFRAISPRFRFDWCASIGRVNFAWERAYPGNAYVDVIGLDIYDERRWTAIADPRARFEFTRKRDHGLDWLEGFAARMHKPIGLSEWGTGGDAAGDDPTFVELMHDWIAHHQVLYHAYWNSDASYPGELSSGHYPAAGAVFRRLFGHDTQPSRSRSSLRSTLRSRSPSQ